MTDGIAFLCGTAAIVGFLHTVLGPDHYLPFVAMSRAGGWSPHKTLLITFVCGVGHVLSSVILGLVGIALGVAVFRLEAIEGFRGDLAGWLLLAFGLVYFVWGVRRAIRNKPHTHAHVHVDGTAHIHEHRHAADHVHIHADPQAPAEGQPLWHRFPTGETDRSAHKTESHGRRSSGSITPWVLFTIFVFGPCEPLIPLLMYPAAQRSLWGVGLVTAIFGVTTLATMTTAVMLAQRAVGSRTFGRYERYSHALAGLAVLVCGAAIKAGL